MGWLNERFAFDGSLVQARLSFFMIFWLMPECRCVACSIFLKNFVWSSGRGVLQIRKTSQVLPSRVDTPAKARAFIF
ncbi:MAG: hypothetical protein KBF33_03680 [Comamonas sp.]|nr:hypothetical protein [Comamonas sp.]